MKKILLMLLFAFTLIHLVNAQSNKKTDSLSGSWNLKYLRSESSLDSLFPKNKPFLKLDEKGKRVYGSAGCNSFSGAFSLHKDSLAFNKPLAMTMIACPFKGETVFVKKLNEVNRYKLIKNELLLYNKNQLLMKFIRIVAVEESVDKH